MVEGKGVFPSPMRDASSLNNFAKKVIFVAYIHQLYRQVMLSLSPMFSVGHTGTELVAMVTDIVLFLYKLKTDVKYRQTVSI